MPKCCIPVLATIGAATLAYHVGKGFYCLSKYAAKKMICPKKKLAILITGACGELGHSLVEALKQKYPQLEMVTMDLAPLPQVMKPFVTQHFLGSVCDKKVWDSVHERYICVRIFHLASLLSSSGERAPLVAADVNINGFLRACEFALKQKEEYGKEDPTFVPRLVFTSSIAAFGVPTLAEKDAAGAVKEDQFLTPFTMYGVTKMQCEQLGMYFQNNYHMLPNGPMVGQIDFRCIRYPGLISAFTVPSGGTSDYGPEMLHMAAQDKPYEAFVLPTTKMPFMTMDDAVTAIIMLSDVEKSKLKQPVYNVSAFAPTAIEIANEVKKHFPKAQLTFTKNGNNPRCNIVNSWPADMNAEAAKRDFGFTPKHSTMAIAFTDYLLPEVVKKYNCKI